MIEIVLKIVLLIVLAIIFQTTYNGVFWKNKKDIKWLWLAILILGVAVAGILGFMGIDHLSNIPFLGKLIIRIDQLVIKILNYIPYFWVLEWFLYPLIAAFIYFPIKGIWKLLRKRRKFIEWTTANNPAKKNSDGKSGSSLKEKKILPRRIKSKKGEDTKTLPIEIDEKYLTNIRYKTALGIQRAYEKAKLKGLQLGKTKEGYIAVYADEKSRQKLITILSGFNIDGTSLVPAPAVVTMENTKYESQSVAENEAKLKGGNK